MSAAPLPRVLLAEDDAEFRALLAQKLTASGFAVTAAANGEDMLAALTAAEVSAGLGEGLRFELVVADVHMPGFSALDVLVGARRCLTATPVLLITAFGDAKTHALGLGLGAAAVLDKPVPLEVLASKARELVAAARERSEGARGP